MFTLNSFVSAKNEFLNIFTVHVFLMDEENSKNLAFKMTVRQKMFKRTLGMYINVFGSVSVCGSNFKRTLSMRLKLLVSQVKIQSGEYFFFSSP